MPDLLVKQRVSFSEPLSWGLGVTYAIHLQLVGKLIVNFLYVIIDHFLVTLTAKALIRRNALLLKGVGHFGAKYRFKSYVYLLHIYTVR